MADHPPCGGCYYFGWDGLKRACFNPETEDGQPVARYLHKAPAKCKRLVAIDAKACPTQWWQEKLTLEQFRNIIRQKEQP